MPAPPPESQLISVVFGSINMSLQAIQLFVKPVLLTPIKMMVSQRTRFIITNGLKLGT